MSTGTSNEILVVAKPTKMALYKYIDGKSCKDVLLFEENKSFREFFKEKRRG